MQLKKTVDHSHALQKNVMGENAKALMSACSVAEACLAAGFQDDLHCLQSAVMQLVDVVKTNIFTTIGSLDSHTMEYDTPGSTWKSFGDVGAVDAEVVMTKAAATIATLKGGLGDQRSQCPCGGTGLSADRRLDFVQVSFPTLGV